jgi:hypothetical protein
MIFSPVFFSFPALIAGERDVLVLTRFLQANRSPLRTKSGAGFA